MSEFLEALEKIVKEKKIRKENRIIFFGANKSSIEMNQYLRKAGFIPEGFVDNSEKKQGSIVEGMPVKSPAEALSSYDPNARILIASEYHKQMCDQLMTFGYRKDEEVFVVHKMYSFYDLSEKAMRNYLLLGDQGKTVYERMIDCDLAGEQKDPFIFMCPYQGTGDAYLIGALLQSYIDKHYIRNYVITVVSKVCERILRMFGFTKVKTISKEESDGLVTFLRMMKGEISYLILNDNYQTRVMHRRLRGYKGIDFRHMFQYAVFGLTNEEKINFPQYHISEEQIRDIMKKHGMVEGKTVLLSPYANTISNLPDEIWEMIAVKYQQQGYVVFTNSSGKHEPTVKGTKSLFLPYSQMVPILEKAGTFIGMRSGLCDIIASAKCKKIILYPAGCIFGSCSTYQYFSLNAMGLCDDAIEIEFEAGKESSILAKI